MQVVGEWQSVPSHREGRGVQEFLVYVCAAGIQDSPVQALLHDRVEGGTVLRVELGKPPTKFRDRAIPFDQGWLLLVCLVVPDGDVPLKLANQTIQDELSGLVVGVPSKCQQYKETRKRPRREPTPHFFSFLFSCELNSSIPCTKSFIRGEGA